MSQFPTSPGTEREKNERKEECINVYNVSYCLSFSLSHRSFHLYGRAYVYTSLDVYMYTYSRSSRRARRLIKESQCFYDFEILSMFHFFSKFQLASRACARFRSMARRRRHGKFRRDFIFLFVVHIRAGNVVLNYHNLLLSVILRGTELEMWLSFSGKLKKGCW